MIKAKIIADSQSIVTGDRLTTLEVVMPRYILAEFNTHRMLSKNSASSRAIPFKKMVKSVQDNPFIPMAWQKDHKGMQGSEYFTKPEDIQYLTDMWLAGRDFAVQQAESLNDGGCFDDGVGATKQMCNRLLEPFMYHTCLVSATEWQNFFNLRCPQYEYTGSVSTQTRYYKNQKDWLEDYSWNHVDDPHTGPNPQTMVEWLCRNKGQADIHIMAVAEAIWDAMNESTPNQLNPGEWHIPFGESGDGSKLTYLLSSILKDKGSCPDADMLPIKVATARCARLSYQTLGEEPKIDYEADLKLHDILLKSGHYSPFEHCARVMAAEETSKYVHLVPKSASWQYGWCRNYRGFIQYRELIN